MAKSKTYAFRGFQGNVNLALYYDDVSFVDCFTESKQPARFEVHKIARFHKYCGAIELITTKDSITTVELDPGELTVRGHGKVIVSGNGKLRHVDETATVEGELCDRF